MKKIYITDLDHTFLKNDLSVSDYTKNIWNSYTKNSIMSIATARTYKKTMQFLQGVEINAPMILLDGALIATQDKKIIDTKFISKDAADSIIEIGAKLFIYPFVISLEGQELEELFLHSHTLNKQQTEVLLRYTKDDNLHAEKNLQAREQNFKLVYIGEKKLLEELQKNLEENFQNSFTFMLAPEAYTNSHFLTILHTQADKSHAIVTLFNHLDYDLNKLTVFGDNFNDLGMFTLAHTSVAVANAQKALKKNATYISSFTNDEDCVAKYLEALQCS